MKGMGLFSPEKVISKWTMRTIKQYIKYWRKQYVIWNKEIQVPARTNLLTAKERQHWQDVQRGCKILFLEGFCQWAGLVFVRGGLCKFYPHFKGLSHKCPCSHGYPVSWDINLSYSRVECSLWLWSRKKKCLMDLGWEVLAGNEPCLIWCFSCCFHLKHSLHLPSLGKSWSQCQSRLMVGLQMTVT